VTQYVLVITQSKAEAETFNALFPPTTRSFRIRAFPYGYAFCGERHYETRPTALVSMIPLSDDDKWVRQCLKPSLKHDAAYIVPQ